MISFRQIAVGATLLLLSPRQPFAQATAPFEVHEASIRELQAAMTDGRTTAVALVDVYLARIEAYDRGGPRINAMIRLNPRAREQAAALDRERRAGRVRGVWHGIPVILKGRATTKPGRLAMTAPRVFIATAPGTGCMLRERDRSDICLSIPTSVHKARRSASVSAATARSAAAGPGLATLWTRHASRA